MYYDNEETIYQLFIGAVVLIGLVIAALVPHFEANSFNECTGGNASYMTALFTELRVENCKK